MLNTKSEFKANLHGHFLPDNGQWWRNEFNIFDKNLAQVVTDINIKKKILISAITNEPAYSNFAEKSRFEQFFEEARQLPEEYSLGSLGNNLFVISKGDNNVYYLDGQTVRGGDVEITTFGSGKVPNDLPLDDVFKYLNDHGLPAVGEHPLCIDHHGMGMEKLEELCANGKLTAIEHNAQLTFWNFPFNFLPKFKHYTRSRNTEAIKIANKYGIPAISNDDSNGITHIGTAYTIFPINRIKFDNGDNMKQSLVEAIKDNDFDTYNGYLSQIRWAAQASRYLIEEPLFRKRFEEKYKSKK